VMFQGTGVLALDGDRDHKLGEGLSAQISIERNGPWAFDIPAAMRHAQREGMIG
jgi:hypothetical protein